MAHVCHLSSVHRALDGRIFYREARSLAQAGYAVTVVARHPSDEIVDGVQVLGLPAKPRTQRPLLWRMLLQRAFATNADLFHIHDPELLAIAPLLRQSGRPVVYDAHEANAEFAMMKTAGALRAAGISPTMQMMHGVRDSVAWMEPQLAAACAGIVAADERIARRFSGLDRPQAILYNYPTLDFVRHAQQTQTQAQAQASTNPTILHLGTHTATRGARLMIEAFAQVRAALPAAQLLLIGPFHPPALAAEIQARAVELGLADGLILAGQRPFAEVSHYLQQADVGWIALQATPKYEMNIPTKLFEYMAYALPVVSSDLEPVRPYLVNKGAGLLVEADHAAAHAAGLLALLRNPAAACVMGERGSRLVETRYNWSVVEPQLLALYDQLLGQAGG